jgi:hypothetical protein
MNKTEQQYLVLFRGNELLNSSSPEEIQKALEKFTVWFESLEAKGITRGGAPLACEGRVISKTGRSVADGPFTESKEAIGGYFTLAVNSLEEAVAIARTFPGLDYGTQVEVRPIAESCPLVERMRRLTAEPALATA